MAPPIGLAVLVVVILVSVPLDPNSSGTLVLATTTSTYDSGLLDQIIPEFEARFDCDVKVIAVGTGQALRLGEAGDADVLLVHAPDLEMEFVRSGHGLYRQPVMYNGFVIVGPRDDPAGLAEVLDATIALDRIAERRAEFCSRGDDSGTHSREKALWAEAGHEYGEISSRGNSDWYLSL
ncbi:MAG: tungsten ABC transporter substrate-binding protein, partial [Thermoplasmata archaeon]|nr:tungsten ABC transporter substrate-binding protein [Thermoplasmata archaeon]